MTPASTSIATFRTTLNEPAPPPGSPLAVQALWWAGKGEWNRAHACAQQDEGDPGCDWVHAFLHRQEGDMPNARYWYVRARRPEAAASLEDEWTAIAGELLVHA